MSEQDASDPEAADEDAAEDADAEETTHDGDGARAAADDADAPDGCAGVPDGEADPLSDVDVDAADGEYPDFEDAVDEALVDHVEESDPASVARELAALRTRVEGLEDQLAAREEELDEVTAKLKRKQADFQNYKKRMEKRREQEKARATEDLIERLTDVRDNLVRALDQDNADVEDLRSGVESTLRNFDRVLEDENVDVVEPEPGEEVDPHTNEVLMRVESDQPEDTVADVHRPGYVMADKVVQTAQVTVSDGSGDGADGEGAADE